MNCQKGELAVIIGGNHPENINAIVEVLEPGVMDGEVTLPHWRVRALCRPLKFTRIRSGETGWAMDAWCYDADLKPIRPNAKPSEESISEPVSKMV